MESITHKVIQEAITYQDYEALIERLFAENTTTNGDNSDGMLAYTRLNIQRSSRWNKRGKLIPEVLESVKQIQTPQTWIVLTEGWCGDSAQNLPFIHLIAESSPDIELKILLRDNYPDIMDAYLTNGARSIPKLIALDTDTLEELFQWGSRPDEAQQLFNEIRHDESRGIGPAKEELHKWYAKNKGLALQKEFTELIQTTAASIAEE
ncbi:MAG: thioredoxin family protein [Bacteroidota bacterium]